MKLLLTGGAGFIGHNVARILESQGHQCYIVDTVTDYGFVPRDELAYLSQERKKKLHSMMFEYDIRDRVKIDQLMELACPDVVIHLASFPRQKIVGQNPLLDRKSTRLNSSH